MTELTSVGLFLGINLGIGIIDVFLSFVLYDDPFTDQTDGQHSCFLSHINTRFTPYTIHILIIRTMRSQTGFSVGHLVAMESIGPEGNSLHTKSIKKRGWIGGTEMIFLACPRLLGWKAQELDEKGRNSCSGDWPSMLSRT